MDPASSLQSKSMKQANQSRAGMASLACAVGLVWRHSLAHQAAADKQKFESSAILTRSKPKDDMAIGDWCMEDLPQPTVPRLGECGGNNAFQA